MRQCHIILLTFVLASFSVRTFAGPYADERYTQLDFPGAKSTVANGINDRGVVVGSWTDSHNRDHIFLYSNGVYKTLPGMKDDDVGPAGINNKGDIVGSYAAQDGIARGFIWKHGVYHKFDIPNRDPHDQLQPEAINDNDEVVGSYIGSDDGAFLYRNGVFTFLKPPHAAEMSTAAHDINDQGQILGQYSDTQDPKLNHAFLFTNGVYRNVDLADTANSTATPFKMANNGVATGVFYTNDGIDEHWYVSAGGSYSLIDSAHITEVTGINDKGEIVGMYEDGEGKYHGFLMSVPIPKPGMKRPAGS